MKGSRSSALVLAFALVAPAAYAEGPTPAAATPAPGLTVSVTADSPSTWRMVLANEGTTPLRVTADVRQLWIEVVGAPTVPAAGTTTAHRTPAPKAFPRGKLPVCRMPGGMRPSEPAPDRALVLKPRERYEETFDPVLLCGAGKAMHELGPGAVAYPSFGWSLPHHGFAKKKKAAPPPPPYVAESTKLEEDTPPVRLVETDALAVPPAPSPAADKAVAPRGEQRDENGAPVDERGPRLTLHAAAFGDFEVGADVAITVTLKNVGKRATTVRVHEDDLEVRVQKPTGEVVTCSPGPDRSNVARELFDRLAPGAHRSMSTMLRERCPLATFDRPGAYSMTPVLLLRERGRQVGVDAFVGRVPAATPTRFRVRTGKLPFYTTPAKAIAAAAEDGSPSKGEPASGEP